MLHSLSCQVLPGVGKKIAEKLQAAEIYNLHDLITTFPYRYEDRTRITPLSQLQEGASVVVEGTIKETVLKKGNKLSMLCTIMDASGYKLTLRFFYYLKAQMEHLQLGTKIRCYGEVRSYRHFELIHPEYEILNEQKPSLIEPFLTPIYSSIAGISSKQIRTFIENTFKFIDDNQICYPDFPATILKKFDLPDCESALRFIHKPSNDTPLALLHQAAHPLQKRISLHELSIHQLAQKYQQQQIKSLTAYTLPQKDALHHNPLIQKFIKNLPFQLTQAQTRVLQEIFQDLTQITPMQRLVQGDVGSGKTIVAAVSCLQVIAQGFQAALMAPTELLAEQHWQNFSQWFQPFGYQVLLLTGSQTKKQKKQHLEEIANGKISMIIGTHAVFQAAVEYPRLALVIIDEQHRFGVKQRLEFWKKGFLSVAEEGATPTSAGVSSEPTTNKHFPHQLIMTATPIPRTMAMILFDQFAVSIIDEIPPGRQPVLTHAISQQRRSEVIQRIAHFCGSGRQVYWVCTLIETSDQLSAQAAEETLQMLQKELPKIKISLVHGKMSALEKETVMHAFAHGEIQLLIATTVIEVGVNVPNATLIIIENPERLGLSQLHQLRGRVGRGLQQSYCILLYASPLSKTAKERLQILRQTNDGFMIAEKDFKLRGAGDLLGVRQTGETHFRFASFARDLDLLPKVNFLISEMLAADHSEVHEAMIKTLLEPWFHQHTEHVLV